MAGARSKDERRRGPFDDTLPASDLGAPPPDEVPAAPVPQQERYRLGAELGRGGMGRVVEAFDLQLSRTVALKEVLPKGGRGTVRRFEREIQLTARLEHPSIVPIYDSGVTPDGRPYYVMRRVSGRPFDELIARARGLDERITLLPSLLAAIDAIAHAHRRGVIHRDLKPQNILVGDLGETIVIDWGLAKVIGEEDTPSSGGAPPPIADSLKTQVGSVFGTPGFMSPEQARGEELSPSGDVFALGATLYQMLAGTPPHQGTSATEVIDKTARHDVRPLVEVAPGAPRELIAIVDKALSFDAAKRYPNAGALGEDVRRFLAGQLVAAHQYTARQRVVRFARRHRAPLGVAASAAVAVAVLSWISVARIITERDGASRARASAVAGQQAAERARDALAERNDALVVTQARSLLEQNPTEAAAVLKALSPSSARQPEARAIAQAAAARGVAWALESTSAFTTIADLEPGGRRLLQVSRDGAIRVWDLDTRRLALQRNYAPDSRALWVAGGLVLVMHGRTAPQLLDPVANTSEPLPIDPITGTTATADGARVLFTTGGRGAKVLEVASRKVTEINTKLLVADMVAAPDGSWFALVDRKEGVHVVDAAGKELTRRAGEYYKANAAKDKLALLTSEGKAVECRLTEGPGGAPVWGEVELPIQLPARVIDLVYRGDELDLWATTGGVFAWTGTRAFQRWQLDQITARMLVVGKDTLILPGADGKVHYLNDAVRGTLQLPSVVPRPRLAARVGSQRLAVVGDGLVVGFDLAAVVPRAIPQLIGMQALFVDDRTLLASRGMSIEWQWIDLETGAVTPFTHPPGGMPEVTQIDSASGRVLVRELAGPQQRLLLFRKGSTEVRVLAEGRNTWGRLLPGDAVVYAVGDGRLFARVGSGEARELVKLDGIVESAVALGYRRYAAHSSSGEVVRGDLSTDDLERARVPAGVNGFLASDHAGRVLVVEEKRILAWGDKIEELARFDRPIVRIDPYEGGAAVHLADHEVQSIELGVDPKPVRILASSKRGAVTSFDGKLIVGLGNAQQLNIVELPSRARWTLPVLFGANDILTVSPTSRRVLQGSNHHFVVWALPQVGPELGPWLDELTNASIDPNGVLAWPWQRAQLVQPTLSTQQPQQ